ncbi:hypothetical protein LGQ02_15955 [Bacillus shivajii]|uniref:hypothetical protein n=1 Tax=Bacillus shivajii TaxID=1983719 RepID=UPI001CFA037F|nr:hypothetical protein [Bacillus shivajii]UCZ52324.1 hypothetical protein LGQ02_15955 [Bacillus shivajii]
MSGEKWKGTFILLAVILLLVACNVSEASVADDSAETFMEKMNQEKMEPTYDEGDLSIYIPNSLDVHIVDEYNIELTRNNQPFLLFLNDQVVYESKQSLLDELMVDEEDTIILEKAEENGEQGYIIATHFDEEHYRVVVGYNKAKVTTISELENIHDDIDMMFDIVQSIEVQ